MSRPDLHLESALWAGPYRLVCGVDEVGRGPLAGPVVAAAVIFPSDIDIEGCGLCALDDSKKLTKKQRLNLLPIITSQAVSVAIGIVSPREIDKINIRNASLLAMVKAVSALSVKPDYVLVDGRDMPEGLPIGQAVIRGDSISVTIAAASVVAKVNRDAIMAKLSKEFPAYGWERNQGYPTKEHRDALLSAGVTNHHRYSFAPVKKAME
ncbi:MAG: ribonuclease HII [Magnetococcales bacterium]|nr:ribonuclease HII [Magnetococcales bacterium]